MTAPVVPVTTSSQAAAATAPEARKGPILGKQDFLAMLVAQLRNQDPLNPMDGAEYAAQLAQFSTVEQLLEIGTKLDGQSADLAQNLLVGQSQLGSALIGREVTLRGAALVSDGDAPGRVILELPEGANQLGIEVFDSSGKKVGAQSFGTQAPGRADLTLDALGLPPGSYSYKVTALDASGQEVAYEAFTVGVVEGMSFMNGQVALRINGSLVPMLDIVEILTGATPAAALPQSGVPTP